MNRRILQDNNVRWVVTNLAGLLALMFLLKDFFAFAYASRHKDSLEKLFIARMVMLPGSLLFWDYALLGALVLNVLFGGFLGWMVSRILLRTAK